MIYNLKTIFWIIILSISAQNTFAALKRLKLCSFTLPGFQCDKLSHNISRPLNLTIDELESLKRTIQNSSDSKYLNIAAPYVNVHPSFLTSLATLGDSISAGLFVSAIQLDFFTERARNQMEQRKLSWSNGGESQDKIFTLFNLLQQASPNLQGGSNGTTRREEDSEDITKIGLNMAVSSRKISELIYQAAKYRRFMNKKPEWKQGWKMINIFAGNNDLCRSCEAPAANGTISETEKFERGVRSVLEKLRGFDFLQEKTIVNLYGLMNITPLKETGNNRAYCAMTRKIAYICSCVLRASPVQTEIMQKRIVVYNQILHKVALEYQMKYLRNLAAINGTNLDNDSFLVFYQPGFQDIQIRDTGLSILSPIDCFHPNFCGHQALAYAAYNSMFSASFNDKTGHSRDIGMASRKNIVESGDLTGGLYQVAKKLNSFREDAPRVTSENLKWKCPQIDTFIQ